MARQALDPATGELSSLVTELRSSRRRMAGAFDDERRRLERDLHDGAQQRLTQVIFTLGLLKLEVGAEGEAGRLTERARTEAADALTGLRDLVRGIRPSALRLHGLPAAVDDAVQRCTVPVESRLELPRRLPEEIESAVYFAVSEALTNVDRHSGASRAWVRLHLRDGGLGAEVGDDGRGGAAAARGSGLTGIADRIGTVDGTVAVSSPPGGPTFIRMEIPCASS